MGKTECLFLDRLISSTMSFSYTVGGKSLTQAQRRNRGQDHEKRESNRAKNPTLSSSKSSGTVQRGSKHNITGEQPCRTRSRGAGAGASSSPSKASGTTNNKSEQNSKNSTIVTLSDLKNQQSKPPTGVKLKPDKIKNNSAAPHSCPGRKLGGNSDSKTSASIGGRAGNQAISQNRPIRSNNSDHFYSRTSASKLNSNNTINVNRTSNTRSIDPTILIKSKTSQSRSPVRGRGSRGPSRGGMADNNRYTSSSLYSANPRPVGQRRPEDEDSYRQQQGEAGPSQGNPQPEQQGESPASGSYRVIQPNASKRQQLINKSSQELKAYEDYKAAKKPTTIYGEAKSTGGSKSEEEARLTLEKQHRNKKYEQILKRDRQRREQREREDKEYEEKKARARQTANENERRRKEREDNVLKDEHAKTNEDFLRRLEGQGIHCGHTSSSQSHELQQLLEMFPNKKPSKLQELLVMTNNDVEKVIDLLMD